MNFSIEFFDIGPKLYDKALVLFLLKKSAHTQLSYRTHISSGCEPFNLNLVSNRNFQFRTYCCSFDNFGHHLQVFQLMDSWMSIVHQGCPKKSGLIVSHMTLIKVKWIHVLAKRDWNTSPITTTSKIECKKCEKKIITKKIASQTKTTKHNKHKWAYCYPI